MRGSVSDPCGDDVVRERVSGLGWFPEVVGSPLWNPGWVGGWFGTRGARLGLCKLVGVGQVVSG